ncbi:hypothetical protein NC653_023362 [Populus alba x Populus x berolinensis]|uniref:Uncharacterized protein n=1 Tax=Populus alba x Populus x berolinensis TaxID=444605 RepID=A0AAD6MH11_9ROSI|nr:hypothetical protein NC653_023362 [Populus alba x Populus x berolinensis]
MATWTVICEVDARCRVEWWESDSQRGPSLPLHSDDIGRNIPHRCYLASNLGPSPEFFR